MNPDILFFSLSPLFVDVYLILLKFKPGGHIDMLFLEIILEIILKIILGIILEIIFEIILL